VNSFVIDDGIAYPHARVLSINKPVLAIGCSPKKSINLKPREGKKKDPVYFIFLCLLPSYEYSMKVKVHKDQIIKMKNEVAGFLRHIKKNKMIKKFKNKDEVFNYINSFKK